MSYRDFLALLMAEEVAHRAETRIQRATRKAKFPFLRTIEEFDFKLQTSVRLSLLGSYLGPELVSEVSRGAQNQPPVSAPKPAIEEAKIRPVGLAVSMVLAEAWNGESAQDGFGGFDLHVAGTGFISAEDRPVAGGRSRDGAAASPAGGGKPSQGAHRVRRGWARPECAPGSGAARPKSCCPPNRIYTPHFFGGSAAAQPGCGLKPSRGASRLRHRVRRTLRFRRRFKPSQGAHRVGRFVAIAARGSTQRLRAVP